MIFDVTKLLYNFEQEIQFVLCSAVCAHVLYAMHSRNMWSSKHSGLKTFREKSADHAVIFCVKWCISKLPLGISFAIPTGWINFVIFLQYACEALGE